MTEPGSRGAGSAGPANQRPARPAATRLTGLAGLLPFIKPYRGHVLTALVFLLLAAASTLALPVSVRYAIDAALAVESPQARQALLANAFLAVFAIAVLVAIFTAARFYSVSWLGERVTADLRSAVYARMLHQGPNFFETTPTGEVISRLTADATLVQSVVGSSLSMGLRNLVLMLGALVLLLASFPRVTGLIVLIVALLSLPVVGLGRRIRRLSRASQDRVADASALATEILQAVPTVQVEGQVEREAARFAHASDEAFATAIKRTRVRAALTVFVIVVNFAALLAGLYIGTRGVIAGTVSAGELGQAVFLVALLAGAVAVLAEVWGDLLRAAGATERLNELLHAPDTLPPPREPLRLPSSVGGVRVRFDQVDFKYPSRDINALSGLSFNAEPGERVALVGPSGAGKSTVFALLLRQQMPGNGRIDLNGVPLARVDSDDLHRAIAVVPQDPVIFSASVAENIRYARPQASDAEVEQAAIAAQAHQFVTALPQGYQTFVGERGLRLSGGQRQRVAIARAILKGAPLLLLDEATSSLDAESELFVQQALAEAMRGRTTLVIAHRLATVQRADRIVVLDSGRVVETGSHGALIQAGGLYARLAALQLLV